MTEQIDENNKQGDIQHLYTEDDIIELFMKFQPILSQDEILREMERKLMNPNIQNDSHWGKIAALLLTCVKTDRLSRLIQRIRNFRRDAAEQMEKKKYQTQQEIYGMIPNKQPGVGKKFHKKVSSVATEKNDSISSPYRRNSEIMSLNISPNGSPIKITRDNGFAMTFH